MMMARMWCAAALLAAVAVAAPSPSTVRSDVTILLNNDLRGPASNLSDSSVLLLSSRLSYLDAVRACQSLNETLWSPLQGVSIQPILNYLVYRNGSTIADAFWIRSGTISAQGFIVVSNGGTASLPALCTQTAPYSNNSFADTAEKWQVTVRTNGEDLIGYRDRLSFRFLGIRYAAQPKRFTYSVPYAGKGGDASALTFGSQCAQGGGAGSEDCLFLNVWTPYLPQDPTGSKHLRPVLFWIHGGAFTGGTANDPTFDGGNFASRGDVVVVAINYRLATLGFLALQDGKTNGNFGLADQIVALDWVQEHIRSLGGDPDRITIIGQSAGAGSVRALMASPKAKGKFNAAIPMSNLGGLAYGTTYSKYYSIAEEMDVAARAILNATGCAAAESQVECLRELPVLNITSLGTVARYIVVDGTYITSPQLELGKSATPVDVKLLMGIMAEDGIPFISYTRNIAPSDTASWLTAQGLPPPPVDLYPPQNISNTTLAVDRIGGRLATDAIFRCIDQATVNAGLETGVLGNEVYYYEFDRAYQTQGWPNLDLCEPPSTTEHPYGDPDAAIGYSKCHSGELLYVFGNLARMNRPLRDDKDLPFEQYVLDLFASFTRTGDPNPDKSFLTARGYSSTAGLLEKTGKWTPAKKGELKMRVLDWPGAQSYDFPGSAEGNMMTDFRDVEQCDWLGLGLDYYL